MLNQRHGSWWRWDEQKPSDRLDPGFERGVGAAAEGAWKKGRGCRWEGRGGRQEGAWRTLAGKGRGGRWEGRGGRWEGRGGVSLVELTDQPCF